MRCTHSVSVCLSLMTTLTRWLKPSLMRDQNSRHFSLVVAWKSACTPDRLDIVYARCATARAPERYICSQLCRYTRSSPTPPLRPLPLLPLTLMWTTGMPTHRGRHAGRPGLGDPRLVHDVDFIPLDPLPHPHRFTTSSPTHVRLLHDTEQSASLAPRHGPFCPSTAVRADRYPFVPTPRPYPVVGADRQPGPPPPCQGEASSLFVSRKPHRTISGGSTPQPSSTTGQAALYRCRADRSPGGF